MTEQQYYNALKHLHVTPHVDCIDLRLQFGDRGTALRKALDESPELEAKLILRLAVNDPDLLDVIQECASRRWCDGYSDSLYSAVLCHIKPTGEVPEIGEDKQVILKDKTDWDAELSRYKKGTTVK